MWPSMLPATLQFLITMIACAINERMQRKLDYTQEEVRVLKDMLKAATGSDRIVFTAQLRARTFDTIPYATATVLESWRNLRHQQGGLLTDALIAGHRSVCCETLFPRLASGHPCCPKTDRRGSCGLPIVEVQHPAEARATGDPAVCPLLSEN